VLELLRALIIVSDDPEKLPIKPADVTLLGTDQCYRIRDYSIQNRLNVGWRAGDDPQYLTRCRLLLQCFGEIAIACLLLVNKPCVLDGDHSLVGEGLKKFDLPV
jgi:hypothetical protein